MPYLSDRFHDQQESVGAWPGAANVTGTGTFDAAAVAQRIARRLLGQDAAVREVRDALLLAQAGFSDGGRPLTSLLLVGPTGVGTTELVRRLAAELRSGPDDFCRVDMGQLAQEHYAASLAGAPPGYAGSREGSSLLDRTLVEGNALTPGIVLFDEVEKAHAVVLRALLGLLDRGTLTLASGDRTISFRNTFVFLTSNLGSAEVARRRSRRRYRIAGALRGGGERAVIDDAVRSFFDPEFLNRLDRVVHFGELTRSAARDVVALHLDDARTRMARRGLELELADGVAEALVVTGFDPTYGARGLRREIRRQILVPAAEALVANRNAGAQACRLRVEPARECGRATLRIRPG